jgi:hypothetical protein
MAQVAVQDPEDVFIGLEVSLVERTMHDAVSGAEVIGYQFRPLAGARSG